MIQSGVQVQVPTLRSPIQHTCQTFLIHHSYLLYCVMRKTIRFLKFVGDFRRISLTLMLKHVLSLERFFLIKKQNKKKALAAKGSFAANDVLLNCNNQNKAPVQNASSLSNISSPVELTNMSPCLGLYMHWSLSHSGFNDDKIMCVQYVVF